MASYLCLIKWQCYCTICKFCNLTRLFLTSSGVSSFNEFVHEVSADSDSESVADSIPGDDDNEEFVCPPSPLSQSSRLSHTSSFSRRDRRLRRPIKYAVSWIIWPVKYFLSLLLILFNAIKDRISRTSAQTPERPYLSRTISAKKPIHMKDQVLQRTTDRRRGVFEVVYSNKMESTIIFSLFTYTIPWHVIIRNLSWRDCSKVYISIWYSLPIFFSYRMSILQLRFSLNQFLTLFIKEHIMFFLLLRCGRSYFAGFVGTGLVTVVLLLMYHQLTLAVIIRFQLKGRPYIVMLWTQILGHVKML